MADSTGPILAAGGLTFANGWLFNKTGPDFRILVGTAIAAGGLALIERVSHPFAVGLAWLGLLTVLFTRTNGKASPAENLLRVSGI
jgi:hypothetical protein